jgi:outer membrane protein TolC
MDCAVVARSATAIVSLQLCCAACGVILFCTLAACASYHPLPLDLRPPLQRSLADRTAQLPAMLTIDDVAQLAVERNPELAAARAQRGVAQAQVLQAGILPNPAVSASYGFLISGPGTTDAWTAGISEDIKSLVTLSARKASARAGALQVDASLLWQEWQVIGKARLLAVDLIEGDKLTKILTEWRDLLASRYERSRRAAAEGNADLTTVAPDLMALGDARRQLDDLERQQQTRRHDLAALLGLSPDATIPLSEQVALPPIDPGLVERSVTSLPNRRPDLIALRLGYAAQDAKVRAAILAQFPTLNFGASGARDNTDVRSFGPQITFELPVFDRNRGNIAIEQATRRQLHEEFSARLAVATGEVEAMLADTALLHAQLARQQEQSRETGRIAAAATAALVAGNLSERPYVDLASAHMTKQQQILTLEQSLLEQQVAMATLIGAGMPAAELPANTAPRQ